MKNIIGIILYCCVWSQKTLVNGAPNILIFHIDDLQVPNAWDIFKPDTEETYMDVDTTNIDKVMNEGFSFSRSYAAGTMCSPSRFAVLTGRYPSMSVHAQARSTATTNGTFVRVPTSKISAEDYVNSIAYQLKSLGGYATGMFGKWHLMNRIEEEPECGVEQFNRSMYASCAAYLEGQAGFDKVGGLFIGNIPDGEGHNPEFVISETRDWMIDRINNSEPFFAYVAPTLTHTPHVESCMASDEGTGDCLKKETPQSLNWTDDNSQLPTRTSMWTESIDSGYNGTEQDYWAKVRWADAMFGSLYDTLESMGQLNNTFIVVVNDHGMGAKDSVKEQGTRIIQVIRYKGIVNGVDYNAIPMGTDYSDFIVSNVDLAPTIFEVAGINVTDNYTMNGASWASKVGSGEDRSDHEFRFSENMYDRVVVWQRKSRSDPWKYLYNPGTGYEAMFNLASDPTESTSLLNNASYVCEQDKLITKMRRHIQSTCPLAAASRCTRPVVTVNC